MWDVRIVDRPADVAVLTAELFLDPLGQWG
jgi:hypothetical protein